MIMHIISFIKKEKKNIDLFTQIQNLWQGHGGKKCMYELCFRNLTLSDHIQVNAAN
jgi:hypothetical protein